ncbi:hypothetical protein BDR07DRAFT_1383025 [Suillus spraguei]|nr:hypothetical protein BDR07DRAFT_1383025 [Suillus spraguei]
MDVHWSLTLRWQGNGKTVVKVHQIDWDSKVIAIHGQCQRHLWLIDWQAGAIGLEMRSDLGDWIKRWLKRGVNGQGAAVQEVLNNCNIEAQDLQEQWADQEKSQLSIHAHKSMGTT